MGGAGTSLTRAVAHLSRVDRRQRGSPAWRSAREHCWTGLLEPTAIDRIRASPVELGEHVPGLAETTEIAERERSEHEALVRQCAGAGAVDAVEGVDSIEGVEGVELLERGVWIAFAQARLGAQQTLEQLRQRERSRGAA
jgi:hypothetical protein